MSLAVDDTFAFVSRAISGRRRVLEVGCGRGELAVRLQAAGHEVTAIDPHVEDPVFDVQRRDLLEFTGGPFDAVLFTRSLHHIGALAAAAARARELVAPGGVLVLEEFDVAAPDEATALWYYEVQTLLAEAGAYPAERILGSPDDAALARWRDEHHEVPPLHPAADMLAALAVHFEPVEIARGPYLYRYICGGLSSLPLARAVRAAEERRLAAGALVPVGVRLVALPR